MKKRVGEMNALHPTGQIVPYRDSLAEKHRRAGNQPTRRQASPEDRVEIHSRSDRGPSMGNNAYVHVRPAQAAVSGDDPNILLVYDGRGRGVPASSSRLSTSGWSIDFFV